MLSARFKLSVGVSNDARTSNLNCFLHFCHMLISTIKENEGKRDKSAHLHVVCANTVVRSKHFWYKYSVNLRDNFVRPRMIPVSRKTWSRWEKRCEGTAGILRKASAQPQLTQQHKNKSDIHLSLQNTPDHYAAFQINTARNPNDLSDLYLTESH